MKYILILTLYYGRAMMVTTEFETRVACENAIAAVVKANEGRTVTAVCIPKG